MGLSASQMASLLAPDKRSSKQLSFVAGEWQDVKLTAETVGAHEGRAGTMQRNRRGVSRRMPNGRRVYNDYDASVQAYMAAKVVK